MAQVLMIGDMQGIEIHRIGNIELPLESCRPFQANH